MLGLRQLVARGITTKIPLRLKYEPLKKFSSSVFQSESITINDITENIWIGGEKNYHLINNAFEGIDQIGIIGWGGQAKSQAKNLRDTLNKIGSDITIKIGLRDNSSSKKDVLNNGFEQDNMYKVLSESDMNLLLISDIAQATHFQDIFEHIKPNSTLGLSHGFLIGYLNNQNEKIPYDLNVIMMAPKGMGPSLRSQYLKNSGINSSIAVHQYNNKKEAYDKAIGWAIGVGSPYIYKTDVENEYISDLFGERAVLLGGLYGILEFLPKFYYEINNNYYNSYNKGYYNLIYNLNDLIKQKGLLEVYQRFGNYDKIQFMNYYNKSYTICKHLFEEIYDEINSGNEIRSILLNQHRYILPIKKSKLLRFNNSVTQEYDYSKFPIEPITAGIYIGAIMAQVDILIKNEHSFSEIVNESIIEATDSLIPYVQKHGLDNMINNCSKTARMGANKWASRLDYLLYQNIPHPDLITGLKVNEHIFINHPIHDAIQKIYKYKT